MTQSEIEQEINQLNDQIKQSDHDKQVLTTKLAFLKTLKNDLNDLSKRESELPPGFKIYWFHSLVERKPHPLWVGSNRVQHNSSSMKYYTKYSINIEKKKVL